MIFRSPAPDLPIPDEALTPFLLRSAEQHGDKPAFIDAPSGRTLTHAGWAAAVRRAAAGLAGRGFGKGDVLAIYSPNCPEYAIAFHAASLIGGIVTTINPLYTPDELAGQLQDAGARLLLTVPAFLDKAREAAQRTGISEIFVFGEAEEATPFAALLDSDDTPPEVSIDPREDLVVLPYSSGTTGLPKGVMLTHHNIVANILQTIAAIDELNPDDTLLGVLPFFHIYGMVVIMNGALHIGATVITVPRFELESFLDTLQRYEVTFAHLVPPIVLALAKHPEVDRYDLSRLRMICSGAAPLSADVAGACTERLGCTVFQGYGLTETSPVTHVSSQDPAKLVAGSIGTCVANTECKVVDLESGAALGPGRQGEVWIRGPQVMKGYLNRPDATSAMIDDEGWLHTGDIGYADDQGRFFIVDRVKELIKYKGMQIAPAELEGVLLSHPAVADAAVVGSPDEEAGEVPKAFVVLKQDVPPQEILEFVAGRVAPYKRIRRIEIVDQVPKSPSGKILRRTLVERERRSAPQE